MIGGMRVAVVGGGINGSGIAWELVRRGYSVTLYDKGRFGAATSSATSKLIHGGLRYLEHFDFGLVRESLRERRFLLRQLPELVKPLEFVLPLFAGRSRPAWMIALGLTVYDLLAGRDQITNHRRAKREELLATTPLRREGLRGGFRFFDAQVDDAALVLRVVSAAVRDGLDARQSTPVVAVRQSGHQWVIQSTQEDTFDAMVIATGPWMTEFLSAHRIPTRYKLTLVRGSHIILNRYVGDAAFLLQSPDDRRVFFALPWKGQTMVGTTEVLHEGPIEQVRPSEAEVRYLVDRFNLYFDPPISTADITGTTSGIRPLIGTERNLGQISREYKIETEGTVINVFGGKMTTFMSLSRKVADRVDSVFGKRRRAKPPVF